MARQRPVSTLHQYDLQLCRYVCASIRKHLPQGLTLTDLVPVRLALANYKPDPGRRAPGRWYCDLPPAEAFVHLFTDEVQPTALQEFILPSATAASPAATAVR